MRNNSSLGKLVLLLMVFALIVAACGGDSTDTTVADAYLSPVLRRYVEQVAATLGDTRLLFMQSNGGLTEAGNFRGKDAILSGPAGGVVGMARTARMAGFDKVIGFCPLTVLTMPSVTVMRSPRY